ncbi:MAG TPA: histidine--tRNA ligase [Patescibacteria group bacterium]|nr:histidine--tRNA ligase [Patescibacteria group bacterium]
MRKQLQSPRGTRDILPEEQKYWHFLFEKVQENMGIFGAERLEPPIFEFAETYLRTIGKGTDIVDKEMFEVRRLSTITADSLDEEENKLMVLRPEYTAGIARAFIQNGMGNLPQPVKLWYFGPCFRYERPQRGRFRIHHQFGIEVFGDDDPLTDAFLILLALQSLKSFGIVTGLKLEINSLGCSVCRPKMKKRLVDYFQNFLEGLCPDCNRRYVENPLRILDCKNEKCQKIILGAPQVIDLLCEECKNHFKQVLENLDSLEIVYNLNPRLVRGLDYYTRTVFEITLASDKENLTLLGGGRYDLLVQVLGGGETPAAGWAAGVERIISALKEKNLLIPSRKFSDVCLIHMGEKARKQALSLLAKLSAANLRVTSIIGKESLKAQLRSASKLGAEICLILGQREYLDKTVIFKDMTAGSQETVEQKKLVEFLKKRLNK